MLGFFKSKKKQGVEASLAFCRPLVAMVQTNYGLPSDFWRDEYVLGFFNSAISSVSKFATNGKITGADLGFAISEVFSNLSNANGVALLRRATDLAVKPTYDFNKGFDDALFLILFLHGKLKAGVRHEIIQEAANLADLEGPVLSAEERRRKIYAYLTMMTFVKELKSRFAFAKGE